MQVIQVYQAHQWHKNGDHPDDGDPNIEGKVVRYFRKPGVHDDAVCGTCGKKMIDHGWIDPSRNKGYEYTVCPGDWILSSEFGVRVPMEDKRFKEGYREYIWESASRIGS